MHVQTHLLHSALPLALLTVLAGCGPSAQDVAELRDQQRQILAKLTELEKKIDTAGSARAAAARPQMDPNRVYDIAIGNSPAKGPKDARVAIIEFSDFQCPFCAQATSLLDDMMKEYPSDVQFVYKQFPLPMHQFAMDASKASLAAGKQGKFWEMHDQLFTNHRALQPEKLKEYAKAIGLDMAKFEADMKSPEITAQIQGEMKQAAAAQVNGTPTIFINGKRLMNRSPAGFRAMIDEALKAKAAG